MAVDSLSPTNPYWTRAEGDNDVNGGAEMQVSHMYADAVGRWLWNAHAWTKPDWAAFDVGRNRSLRPAL